jgi:hypothetical protein
MIALNLFTRLTHTYADGYNHLDDHAFVSEVKLTPPKKVREALDYDDGGTFVQYMRVPRGVATAAVKQALRDTLSGSNCRHEHDCCGCASRHVQVKQLAARRLLVRTTISYNY